MRRFLVGFFAVIGVVAVLGILALIGATVALVKYTKAPPLPATIVLTADLTGGLSDTADPDTASRLLFGAKSTLRDFVDAVDRAAADPRVKSLYVELGDDSLGLARTQQVRDTIAAFRAKGKFVVAFADTFGEGGPGTRPYYLATACDEIWLQPLGEVGLIGLRSETPFLKGLLDKLGIVADFERREEYKTATNALTETRMTGPQREEIEGLLGSIWGQIGGGVAKARKLVPDKLAALVDRAPLSARDAQQAGLVDKIGYRDQALSEARVHAGTGAKFMTFAHYLKAAGRPHASGSQIALIYGTGFITRGDSGGLADEDRFTARTIGRAFAAASRNAEVRAIVFRIDSPGGSATASETIWRNVEEARRRGKPVIVSMGDVAASGGYYVAAPADKIVAEPATLTGSIGVLAGKLVLGGLWDKLGVSWDTVNEGANVSMFSTLQDFAPPEKERFEIFLDAAYGTFKDRVAKGRKLGDDGVEAVAKGRVWTGEDAKARGLVDALGGLATALRLAKQAANIREDQEVTLKLYPRAETLGEAFGRLTSRRHPDDDSADADALTQRLGALRTLLYQIERATAPVGSALMPSLPAP